MAVEWSMRSEFLGDTEAINEALQQNWEPFSVVALEGADDVQVFFRRQFFSEASEPKSSTREENRNWAGNPHDESGDGGSTSDEGRDD